MGKFAPEMGHYCAIVVQSEGYEKFVEWFLKEIPREWQNGIASHVTHMKPSYPDWDDAREQEIRDVGKKLDKEATHGM